MGNAAEKLENSTLGSQEEPQLEVIAGGKNVEGVLAKYKQRLAESKIFEVDKRMLLEQLDKKPAHEHNADHLLSNIAYVPKLEEAARKDEKDYGKKADELNEKGKPYGLVLVREQSKKEYIEWLGKQPYEERKKILEQPFYKTAERLKLFEDFKRIPEAQRKESIPELNKLGLEEKQKIIEKLAREHEDLKKRFFVLPAEVQSENREKFKDMTLKLRAEFLKKFEKNDGKDVQKDPKESAKEAGEKGLEKELMDGFAADTKKFVDDNLMAPQSKIAHDDWFDALSLDQKKRMRHGSEVHTRLKERVAVRDQFYALDPKIHATHDLEFRNIDLDKRIALLRRLTGINDAGKPASYDDKVVEKNLALVLKDPRVQEKRLMFTMISDAQHLVRRAEIRYQAQKTEDIADKAQEKKSSGTEEHQTLNIERMEHHGEARFGWKRWFKKKLEKGRENEDAMATNLTLENREHVALNALDYKEKIVDHEQGELEARIIELSRARMPRADEKQLQRIAHKMKLDMSVQELQQTAA